ncbi:MAG: sigma factor, partial [Thiohalomonadales bacterium]
MSKSDKTLEQRRSLALNGKNNKALTLFLREIRGMTLKYTQVRVGNESLALDILQDTMLGFVQVVDRYERTAWKNLFFKILNRRITDHLRKQTWRNRLAQILPFSQIVDNN